MEHWELRTRHIRSIPRHAVHELRRGELLALALVTLLGLTGILGTLVTAWWLALN